MAEETVCGGEIRAEVSDKGRGRARNKKALVAVMNVALRGEWFSPADVPKSEWYTAPTVAAHIRWMYNGGFLERSVAGGGHARYKMRG